MTPTQQPIPGMESLAAPEIIDRRKFIGGSDVASIFGLSPWRTPYDLWEQKTADEPVVVEMTPEREKVLRRGKRLEPWVLEMVEEECGVFPSRRNQIYCDEEYDWMRCEVDFEFIGDDGLTRNGEIKTVSPFAASEWGEEQTDEIPLYYALQTFFGLSVTKRPETLVAGLIGADDLRLYWIKRDEELIGEIRKRVLKFWNEHVIPKVPPAPQEASDTKKILAKYGGFVCPASDEVCEWVRRLKGVKEAEKRLKSAREGYEFQIQAFLTIQAQAMDVPPNQEKFQIVGPDGNKLATLSKQDRKGYTVQPTSFYVLRT